jgi:hypothetical protein
MKKILMLLAFVSFTAGPLIAISSQITFQGTLKQDGVPVNANKNMQFSFVDGTGATIPGTAPIPVANVQVTNGLFAVQLPIDTTVNWQAYQPYIQVSVEGQILNPNQPLTSNMYSIVSQTVIDNAIVTVKIADSAITTNKLTDQSVTTGKLADASVTAAKLDPSVQGITVPSGLIALFAGPCPTGWSRFSALDNAFPMGGPNYGAAGGSATHIHTLSAPSDVSNGVVFTSGQGSGSTWQDWGRADHVHGVSRESNVPPYVTMVYCVKS